MWTPGPGFLGLPRAGKHGGTREGRRLSAGPSWAVSVSQTLLFCALGRSERCWPGVGLEEAPGGLNSHRLTRRPLSPGWFPREAPLLPHLFTGNTTSSPAPLPEPSHSPLNP